MTKFKSKPRTPLRALPNEDEVATFTAGAATRTAKPPTSETTIEPRAESVAPLTPAPKTSRSKTPRRRKSRPWDGLDPKAKPTSGMNVRLNEYQLSMLRFIAEAEERSIQQIIKRLLIPVVEADAERLSRNRTEP